MEVDRQSKCKGGSLMKNPTKLFKLTNEIKSLVKISVSHMDYCLYGNGKFDRGYMQRYVSAIREKAEELERELEI